MYAPTPTHQRKPQALHKMKSACFIDVAVYRRQDIIVDSVFSRLFVSIHLFVISTPHIAEIQLYLPQQVLRANISHTILFSHRRILYSIFAPLNAKVEGVVMAHGVNRERPMDDILPPSLVAHSFIHLYLYLF